MSGQQPNAWQTAGRPRHSHSASRTPQSRSGTASPSQQSQPSQQPRQDSGRPQQANNVWAQRSSSTSGSNGQPTTGSASAAGRDEGYVPANGFNAADVKAVLGREAGPTAYKVIESTGARGNGSAWGAKANHMANNQPFFVQLAKQIATLEGGG